MSFLVRDETTEGIESNAIASGKIVDQLYSDSDNANLQVSGNLTVNGQTKCEGQITCNKNITSEQTMVAKSHLASSKIMSDGLLIVSGESTLESAVNIGDSLTVEGSSSLQSDLNIGDSLTVEGTSSLQSTVSIGSDANISGKLTVTGKTTLDELTSVNVSVSSNCSIGTLTVYEEIIAGSTDSEGNVVPDTGNITALGSINSTGSITTLGGINMNGSFVNSSLPTVGNPNFFARLGPSPIPGSSSDQSYNCNNFNRPDISQNEIRSMASTGSYFMFGTQLEESASPTLSSGLINSSWMSTFTLNATVTQTAPAYTFVDVGSDPVFGQELTINYVDALNSASDSGPNQDNIVLLGFAAGNTPGAKTYNIIANCYNKSVGNQGGGSKLGATSVMFAGYDETPFLSSDGAPFGGGVAGQSTPYLWIPTCCIPLAPGAARKFVYMQYSNTSTYPDGTTIFPKLVPSTQFLFQEQGNIYDGGDIEYYRQGSGVAGIGSTLPDQTQYLDGGAWVEITTAPINTFPSIFD